MAKKGATMETPPTVYVIGGPNGAGKTTLANRLLPEFVSVKQFVNADLIARGLSPFDPESVVLEAGRLLVQRIEALAQHREDFAVESTLAARSLARRLGRLKATGYRVHLAYLWLPSPEMAVERVAYRIRHGGHSVPHETIRRRYAGGLRNLFALYLPLADEWVMYDNSLTDAEAIASSTTGRVEVHSPSVFETIRRLAES